MVTATTMNYCKRMILTTLNLIEVPVDCLSNRNLGNEAEEILGLAHLVNIRLVAIRMESVLSFEISTISRRKLTKHKSWFIYNHNILIVSIKNQDFILHPNNKLYLFNHNVVVIIQLFRTQQLVSFC